MSELDCFGVEEGKQLISSANDYSAFIPSLNKIKISFNRLFSGQLTVSRLVPI